MARADLSVLLEGCMGCVDGAGDIVDGTGGTASPRGVGTWVEDFKSTASLRLDPGVADEGVEVQELGVIELYIVVSTGQICTSRHVLRRTTNLKRELVLFGHDE